MSEVTQLRDRFLKVLTDAQTKHRKEADWIQREHQAVLDAVNEELLARRRDPIDLRLLRRIEQPALGHVDYSSKFALYCAELVTNNKEIK